MKKRFPEEQTLDFLKQAQARVRIVAWQRDYTESRPHSTRGDMTPAESAAK